MKVITLGMVLGGTVTDPDEVPLVISTAGAHAILKTLAGQRNANCMGSALFLYQSNTLPTRDSVEADFVECNFPGYEEATANDAFVGVDESGTPWGFASAFLPFPFSADADSTQLVRGAWIMIPSGPSTFLGAALFPEPVAVKQGPFLALAVSMRLPLLQ